MLTKVPKIMMETRKNLQILTYFVELLLQLLVTVLGG